MYLVHFILYMKYQIYQLLSPKEALVCLFVCYQHYSKSYERIAT